MDRSTHMASQRFDIDLKKIGLWGSLSESLSSGLLWENKINARVLA